MNDSSKDPRYKNTVFSTDSLGSYLKNYSDALHRALSEVDPKRLENILKLMQACKNKGNHCYSGGNGGSAAIADHLCCDWMKGTYVPGQPTFHVQSLTSSPALNTALANDFSFEQALARHIQMVGKKGDVVILISSSGNSPNILAAAQAAKKIGMIVVGLVGFSGGNLPQHCDEYVHINVNNYGVVEDAHQAIMHILAQFMDVTNKS